MLLLGQVGALLLRASSPRQPIFRIERVRQSHRREQGQSAESPMGTADSEKAVRAGLAWLLRQQQGAGNWQLDGKFPDNGPVANDVAATAMAPSHARIPAIPTIPGAEAAPCAKAIDKGAEIPDPDASTPNSGEIGKGATPWSGRARLCEAYGMTKADRPQEARRSLPSKFLVNTQHDNGGWRYTPGQAGDLSIAAGSSWFLHRQQAETRVPAGTLRASQGFLDVCCDQRTEGYASVPGRFPHPDDGRRRAPVPADGGQMGPTNLRLARGQGSSRGRKPPATIATKSLRHPGPLFMAA